MVSRISLNEACFKCSAYAATTLLYWWGLAQAVEARAINICMSLDLLPGSAGFHYLCVTKLIGGLNIFEHFES